ncbi:MAG: glycosyltransferase family protein [Solirubrobacterales bacterium]
MKILYGVNGEGRGHATRSQVAIDELLKRHDVRIVASGAAFEYLKDRLPKVEEVFGPSFALEEGEIKRLATVRQTVVGAGRDLPQSIRLWIANVREWQADVVITDFEPLTGIYARFTRTPMVAVDNIHMVDRCKHDEAIVAGAKADYRIAKAVTAAMVPGAVEYLVLTFFDAPFAFYGTMLIPPILRPEVVDAEPEDGDHLVVYSSGDPRLNEALRASGMRCLVYGMRAGADEPESDGMLEFRQPSTDGFLEDLRTARAVVTGGGFSLLSEAVYLRKPVLAVPLHGQFEQLMNARYLERNHFGACALEVTPDAVREFVGGLEGYEQALSGYEQRGNEVALAEIEEAATRAAAMTRREQASARRTTRRIVL